MTDPVHPSLEETRARDNLQSLLRQPIRDESEMTAGVKIRPGGTYGFFTDSSLCIGCKACEVACKEWNLLPADDIRLSGTSYDNTRHLSATTWRHVAFIEKFGNGNGNGGGARPTRLKPFQSNWLMMSDVCKHCRRAGCLEACPTGALFRTQFGTVVVQQDICNGCAYCVPACPFGVIALNMESGKAYKCTLCYDRLKGGFEPACSKTCPTHSIQFGEIGELVGRARRRVERLHQLGVASAYLYGAPGGPGTTGGIEQLFCFSLLLDRPETYNLPVAPKLPSRRVKNSLGVGLLTAAAIALASAVVVGTTAGAARKERRRAWPLW
jgi:formate dehydrogenase iron-sulfur subunit